MNGDMFPPANKADVTTEEKIKELERELRTRWHVYPRMVKAGNLNQQTADKRILIIESIIEDYQRQRSGESI